MPNELVLSALHSLQSSVSSACRLLTMYSKGRTRRRYYYSQYAELSMSQAREDAKYYLRDEGNCAGGCESGDLCYEEEGEPGSQFHHR